MGVSGRIYQKLIETVVLNFCEEANEYGLPLCILVFADLEFGKSNSGAVVTVSSTYLML